MTIERIMDAFSARPFVPFTIHIAGGRSIRVGHPEMFVAPPEQRTFAVYSDRRTIHVIDLLLVSELEVDEASHE